MHRYALVLGSVCLIFLGGCPKPQAPVPAEPKAAPPPAKLTILCGGSFRPPLEALASKFHESSGIEAELSFGQSEDLLPQIKVGKVGDIFVTHDPYLEYTKDAGALMEGVHVGYVAPVLVVPKGNPAGVERIEDLARPGLKVALPNPEYSTCGEMLAKLLEAKGIKEAVLSNAGGAVFRSHSETGTALTVGGREAGVMWNGTAYTFRDDLDIVPTPYEYDETIKVWVMGLSYTKNEAAVRGLLDFARSEGTGIFAEYGYVR